MPDAIRLTRHIYLVGSGEVGLSEGHDCHCYLVDAGSCCILVDAGAGIDSGALVEKIEQIAGDGKPLTDLLLTHCHADHSGGAAGLQRRFGLRVWAGELCASRILSGVDQPLALDVARAEGVYPANYRFEPPQQVESLADGRPVVIGDCRVQPILTPGHSADSTCFWMDLPEGKALFCGDTLFASGLLPLLNTFDSELSAYRSSVHKLQGSSFDILCPGHGLFILKDGQAIVQQLETRLSHSIYIPPVIIP